MIPHELVAAPLCLPSMKKYIALLAAFLCTQPLSAQVANYQSDFNTINKNLMTGLGSYAISNFAVSGVGYFTADQEQLKRFHEMNVMWNTVNLGLAIPGYIKATRPSSPLTLDEMIKQQRITERVFLINGALDVGYIGAGLWMRSTAPNQGTREDQFTGYGNSLILQGSFLMAFDLYAYWVHHQHGKQLSSLDKVSVMTTAQGIGLVVRLD